MSGNQHRDVSEDVHETEVNHKEMRNEEWKIEAKLPPAHHASR